MRSEHQGTSGAFILSSVEEDKTVPSSISSRAATNQQRPSQTLSFSINTLFLYSTSILVSCCVTISVCYGCRPDDHQ